MASSNREQREVTMNPRQAGNSLSGPFDMGIGKTFDFIYLADVYQFPQQECCKNLQRSLSFPRPAPWMRYSVKYVDFFFSLQNP